MNNEEWLPLLNYSTKHNISLSTLRRRIKANSIQYKLDHGKYFILDESAGEENLAPIQQATTIGQTPAPGTTPTPHALRENILHHEASLSSSFVEASVLSSANRLVEEIKSAYAKILQEKEEQISLLKEEVVDLRMLCRILEDTSNKKPSPRQAPGEGQNTSNSNDFLFGDYQTRDL